MDGSKVALWVELGDRPPSIFAAEIVVGLEERRWLLVSVDVACRSCGGDPMP
jgi:hypothetical protein